VLGIGGDGNSRCAGIYQLVAFGWDVWNALDGDGDCLDGDIIRPVVRVRVDVFVEFTVCLSSLWLDCHISTAE
jgi:hypothetical protein